MCACMHCGSQLAADCHLMHSSGHKNFAGWHSLEKLYAVANPTDNDERVLDGNKLKTINGSLSNHERDNFFLTTPRY